MPILKEWSLGVRNLNPYSAPETGIRCLRGKVYDDDRFEEGKRIYTSEIKTLNTQEKLAVTNSKTVYVLDEPDPEWLDWINKNGYNLIDFDIENGMGLGDINGSSKD